ARESSDSIPLGIFQFPEYATIFGAIAHGGRGRFRTDQFDSGERSRDAVRVEIYLLVSYLRRLCRFPRGQNSRATLAPASAATPPPAVVAPATPGTIACDTAPAAAFPERRPAAGRFLPVFKFLTTKVLPNACFILGPNPRFREG